MKDSAFGCYRGDKDAEEIETLECDELFKVEEISEDEIEENKFIQTDLVVYDKVYEHEYSFSVSTGFEPNVHVNAYRDYYTGALNRYFENMYEIQGLTYRAIVDEARIDMYGKEFHYKNSWMIDTHSS